MSLSERAGYYYGTERKGCGVAICLAARDVWGVSISDAEALMMAGFNGGMGCGSTCGALIGGVAVLTKLYASRDDLRALCAGFHEAFRAGMEADTIECAPLEKKYRTEADRCVVTVEKAAEVLEKYVDHIEGRDKKTVPAGEGCTVPAADIKRVKGQGFLNQKGTNKFNGRIITRNGKITSEEAAKMAEVAKKYGDGSMMLTTRLTMEISGIDYSDIENFQTDIAEVGLYTGGTGSKVRPVVSCKGTTCQYGNCDTYALSDKIHNRFYLGYHNVDLPHKFKIAVGGCPNNCVKPNLNDLGIMAVNVPQFDPDKCRGCKVCQVEKACPIHACSLVDGKLVIDPAKCNNCGRCVTKCPFHANDEGKKGYRIYVGGRWGKNVAHGRLLTKIFFTEEEVLDTVEKAILLFRSEGISGERFADTIERLGFDKVNEMLLGNELLEKKAEIIGLNVVGGASC